MALGALFPHDVEGDGAAGSRRLRRHVAVRLPGDDAVRRVVGEDGYPRGRVLSYNAPSASDGPVLASSTRATHERYHYFFDTFDISLISSIMIIIIAETAVFNVAGYLVEGRRRLPVIQCFPTGIIFQINSEF